MFRSSALLPALIVSSAVFASACGGGSSSPTSPGGSSGGPTRAALGYRFTADGGVRVSNAIEPNVLVTSTATLLATASASPSSIQSSTDGLLFGPRAAQFPGNSRSQSFVALPTGGYRMYYRTFSGTDLLSATSPDGLTWTNEAGSRISLNSIAVPYVAAVPGGYRVYYVTNGGPTSIASAFSSDGLTFTLEGIRIPSTDSLLWADPSVSRLDDGTYLMTLSDAFTPSSGTSAKLYLATSPDSMTWTVDTEPIVSDPSRVLVDPSNLVSLGGGRYRFYYASATGTITSLGTSTILSGVIQK